MKSKRIRYGVVGLGSIAQSAVLPAFKNSKHSDLTALISGNDKKLKQLGKRYKVKNLYTYDNFHQCLTEGKIDALYIATPNTLHRRFAIEAADAGVHVLCEKPLAATVEECQAMIDAAERNRVKLMTAYRLHFEESNLKAIKTVKSGKLGEPLFFTSNFGFLVKDENIRLDGSLGGGPLLDIGLYCINAARYIFRDEPIEVFAYGANSGRKRFAEVDETVSAIMKFPEDKIAAFTCSFGSAPLDAFQVVGSRGFLQLNNAYNWESGKELVVNIKEKEKRYKFKKTGQFAAEIDYFSDCIINNRIPEPSGLEGLQDIRIVEALQRSITQGRPVMINESVQKRKRPELAQQIKKPPTQSSDLVDAESPADEAA